MLMKAAWVVGLLGVAAAACASTNSAPLRAETSRGSAGGPVGKVLVVSTNCGSMESICRNGWAETIDGIVVGDLEFRGYATIDPASLHKDEATRTESTVTGDVAADHASTGTSTTVGVVAIFPVASVTNSSNHSVSVSRSKQKTIVVTGATIDELRPEDRQTLLELAGAQSLLSTRLVVGANYDNWSSSQEVEVMVKLSDARSGAMRVAARCTASSADFPSVEAAIEAAARCAVGAVTRP